VRTSTPPFLPNFYLNSSLPFSFLFRSLLHSRNLQQWKKQKQEYDSRRDQWRETKKAQKALYKSGWDAEVKYLEGTLSLFPCLGQLNLSAREKGPSLPLSLSSLATITSLQCLILRKAVLEEHQIITICNHASSSLFPFLSTPPSPSKYFKVIQFQV